MNGLLKKEFAENGSSITNALMTSLKLSGSVTARMAGGQPIMQKLTGQPCCEERAASSVLDKQENACYSPGFGVGATLGAGLRNATGSRQARPTYTAESQGKSHIQSIRARRTNAQQNGRICQVARVVVPFTGQAKCGRRRKPSSAQLTGRPV